MRQLDTKSLYGNASYNRSLYELHDLYFYDDEYNFVLTIQYSMNLKVLRHGGYLKVVAWPPLLNVPPPFCQVLGLICAAAALVYVGLKCYYLFCQVINPLITTSQCLATQTCRDENPDKFVLTWKEQQEFRKKYPLRRTSLLPPRASKDNKPTLVLDLDETLIHTTFDVPPDPHNLEKVNITLLGTTKTLFVNMRPYLRMFLKTVSQWYEIVIYTASLPAYADRILDGLDPSRVIFSHRLYREHCSFYNGIYIKDMETLGRPLNKIVFVDNFPGAYMMQPSNALPVRSFVGSIEDTELFQLTKLLKILRQKEDVRPLLNRYRTHWKRIHFGSSHERESDDQTQD